MRFKIIIGLAFLSLVCITKMPMASATLIDFTGGTATRFDASTWVTDNVNYEWGIDKYEELGFRFDYLGGEGNVGNYFDNGSDLMHWHDPVTLRMSAIDGSLFTLESFQLTTNTTNQDGPFGNMLPGAAIAHVNSSSGASYLLPAEMWGLGFGSDPIIALGAGFQSVNWVEWVMDPVNLGVAIDNVVVTDPVPEPATIALLGIGLAGLAGGAARRKWKKKAVNKS